MKKLLIHGLSIAYEEIDADAPVTLVYLHGNSHSKTSFQGVMTNPCLDGFRQIAVDLPGHGASSPNDTYSLPFFAEIVAEFVRQLDLKKFVLIGHSLGGHVAIQASTLCSPSGIITFGAPFLSLPLPTDAFLPHDLVDCFFTDEVNEEKYAALMVALDYPASYFAQGLADIRASDALFRSSMLQSIVGSNFIDETKLLSQPGAPVRVFVCTEDKLVNADYIRRVAGTLREDRLSLVEMPLNHSPNIQDPQHFASAVLAFVDSLSGADVLTHNPREISLEQQY